MISLTWGLYVSAKMRLSPDPARRWHRERRSVEVIAAVVLTTLLAAALAVIFGVTALRDSGVR